MNIKERNIVLCIIFSIITCGIYDLYWFVTLTDDVNNLADDHTNADGVMALILTVITCSIYGWFWAYKMGEKVDKIKGQSGSSPILFIILQLCGLGIVNYCIIQDAINKARTDTVDVI